jgi:hypothetical protein
VLFAILSNKRGFDSYGNLSYFVFAHESLPCYKAQLYVIRFSLEFKSMMKVLAKFFPTKFDSNMEIFFFETYSSRIFLQCQNCCHILFFSWIQLRLKSDFLSKTLIFESQNKFMWHYCPLRLALLFTHPKGSPCVLITNL